MTLIQEIGRCLVRLGLASRGELSPGALYRLMSAEFQARRRCDYSCSMPMIFTADRARHDGSNWSIEEMWPQCGDCRPLSQRIARKYAARYNVKTFGPPQREPDRLGHIAEEDVALLN